MSLEQTAPSIFISYSHDSQGHKDRVRSLADRLRKDGIDATIDQYEVAPPEGWPVWMEREVRESDFVLVVCTETYLKRAERREEPGKGRGVMWESVLAYQHIYDAQSTNTRFIPIFLESNDSTFIPVPLRSTTAYPCTNDQEYEELYRRLTDQPRISKPQLGKLKSLEPRQFRNSILKPWNIPYERNEVFVGRDEVLQRINTDLAATKRQVLSGLGGIGKSQIALEYAYRYQSHYSAVFWVFADSEQSISTDFIKIAQLLELPVRDMADQSLIVDAVKRWLDQNDNWLLIFDNADSPEALVAFLPRQKRGQILLTSRASVFQSLSIVKPVDIDVLGFAAARDFLLTRTGRDPSMERPEHVDTLANELGFFPLALEQAGAFIAENQTSFENYLKSYQKRRLQLLELHGPVMGHYKQTVVTTWALNFAEVQRSSASADLLRLSAFLSPEAISLELLQKGRTEIGEALASTLETASDDPVLLDQLFKPLTSYSLIHRNFGARSFSIHPLVQEVIREGMPSSMRLIWMERAVRAVAAAFPEAEFKNWTICGSLISSALLCAKYVYGSNFEFPEAALLLARSGFYLHQRAQYTEAEPLYTRALAIREKIYDTEHPETAESLNKLGWLYHDQGKFNESERFLQRSLEIREKVLGSEHADTATSMNDLAVAYDTQGNKQSAEQLYRASLAIRTKVLGDRHPDTALSMNNLADVYREVGKYEAAEEMARLALDIRRGIMGPDHPATAASLETLGRILTSRGKYQEAESVLRDSLQICEKTLGPQHPHTAERLMALDSLYYRQKRYAEAFPISERALAIAETALGPNHARIAFFLRNLGLDYSELGKQAKAEALLQRSLELLKNSFGVDNPETIIGQAQLAWVYLEQARYSEAERLLRTALEMQERMLPKIHPQKKTVLAGLAELYRRLGKNKKAKGFEQRVRKIERKQK